MKQIPLLYDSDFDDSDPIVWLPHLYHDYGWHVYLMGSDYGWYKIGAANDPLNRKETLGILLPFKITLIHAIQSDRALALERKLHKMFDSKRINGEWFTLDQDDIAFFKSLPPVLSDVQALDIVFQGETYDYKFAPRVQYESINWSNAGHNLSRYEFILLREFVALSSGKWIDRECVNPRLYDALDSIEERGWIMSWRPSQTRQIFNPTRDGRAAWSRIISSLLTVEDAS